MINSHFIGRDPDFTPYMASSTTVSFTVRQFVELLRGERAVQAPANGFRVEAVRAEEHYCLNCLAVRWHDVIYGVTDRMPFFEIDLGMDVHFKTKRCRKCGEETVA